MALAAEIARAKGNKKASEVTELVLDKCSVASLSGGEFDGFTNLQFLSLNNVGLTSLDNFPSLQHLKRLELNDNKIAGGLDVLQEQALINLAVLHLSGNRIKSLDDLQPLGSLPNLKQLDLEHCEVASLAGYREALFEMIPSLKVLDNLDRNGDEVDLDEEDDEEDGDSDAAQNEDYSALADDDADERLNLDLRRVMHRASSSDVDDEDDDPELREAMKLSLADEAARKAPAAPPRDDSSSLD